MFANIFIKLNLSFMPKQFLFICLLALAVKGYSQIEKPKIGAVGISIPIIWNNSEATYYSLGSPKYSSGNAVSYGVNVNLSRTIYKNLFVLAGIGYFKQEFEIKRPFDYRAPDGSKPLVYTEYYSYYGIRWLLGIGYQKVLSKNLSVKGTISYNMYNSYKQKYAQKYFPGINEIYKKPLSIGSTINFDLGMERYFSNKVSVGVNGVVPVYTKWNKDAIFFGNGYANNEQQIARNKFSIGAVFSCYYHF